VRRVSLAEAIQINEARGALERLVAARAARRAGQADHAELREVLAATEAAVAAGEALRYSELNALLHRRLREISDHPVADDLVRALGNRAAHHQYRLALMPGRPEQSLPEHRAIVEAVVAGDEDGAAAAMERHLAAVVEVLRHWADLEVPV
jgi:DNA-binding GntR family transcriptional regulator